MTVNSALRSRQSSCVRALRHGVPAGCATEYRAESIVGALHLTHLQMVAGSEVHLQNTQWHVEIYLSSRCGHSQVHQLRGALSETQDFALMLLRHRNSIQANGHVPHRRSL